MKKIVIIQDNLEKRPLDFSRFDDVSVEVQRIWPGDYTLKACTDMMAVERKSVSDLIGTLFGEFTEPNASKRKRFNKELCGMRGYTLAGYDAFVLVEPDGLSMSAIDQIDSHNYQSSVPPKAVWAKIRQIECFYHVPVEFSKSREHSAEIIVETARKVMQLKDMRRARTKALERKIQGEML